MKEERGRKEPIFVARLSTSFQSSIPLIVLLKGNNYPSMEKKKRPEILTTTGVKSPTIQQIKSPWHFLLLKFNVHDILR